MRKTFSFIVMMLAMVFAFASIFTTSLGVNNTTRVTSAASLSDNAIITLAGETNEDDVIVKAYLQQNTAITGMTLEISYDTSAMTLTNVERGTALSSLDYMTTNVDTEEGYGIIPFKINWSGDENDKSTGLLITMHFAIKEGAVDGEYPVTLKSEKMTVTYIDGDLKTKSALADKVKIYIKGSSVTKIINESDENNDENNTPIVLIISLSVGGTIAVAAGSFIFFKLKGKKAWTKIK